MLMLCVPVCFPYAGFFVVMENASGSELIRYNVPHTAGEARAILSLAIPLAVAHIAMVGMEVIDTIVAGQYSAQDLAGLAMGGSIWLILVLFMVGVLGAVLPRMARFYGADDGAECYR